MEREGKVWVPDAVEGFKLGQICDIGTDTITVQPAGSKKLITAPYDRVYPAEHQDDKDVEDNCALMFLNEATLLQNLRVRYKKDKIYAYVANILLAVNPYHDMKDLYSPAMIKKYHGKSLGVLPPHIFAIADKAYRDMRSFKQSQSIIVSGESGAGKTESTKYILRYLTDSWGSGSLGHIEQRIVEANPLLESFGNAKTLRNINSSRFGKYVEVHFNEKCTVVGGFISHYLLEKSRVCTQSSGERNYHVFYRLCSGAPADLKNKLGLEKAQSFNYLNRGAINDPHLDDKMDFKRMVESMDNVGFSADEKANLFRVVAAVMHIGNITFEEDHEDKKGGCIVSDSCQKSVDLAARLLGVESGGLKTSLTSRMMQAPNMGTLIKVPLKVEQAGAARDALAKALYSKLFDHTVGQVNQCFPFKSSRTYIGVLDIAGFEYFQVNSFEQFCINYCNEKLQQFFNDRILKQEQELYNREGLGVSTIKFVDNQDCIDLIEAKTVGILDLLDEESKLPKSTAEHFTTEVHEKHKGHFRLAIPRKSHLVNHRNLRDSEGFLIRHFAGAVCYHTAEFIEKNNDALHSDLEDLIRNSRDAFVKALYPSMQGNTQANKLLIQHGGRGGARKLALDSIGSKFRTQLNELMEKLDKTGANFIRCIKPNSKMASQDFEGGLILSQLQCAGMVSVLNLMHQGFPSRTQFKELYRMYQQYLPPQLARLDPRTFCQALFHALGMKNVDYRFGMTKVFFRPGKFAQFDQMLKCDPENLKDLVEKVKHFILRTRWKRAIFCAISVEKLARKIQYRAQAVIKIQKSVRMFLALCKHKPRYQAIMKIKKLQVQSMSLQKIVQSLKKDGPVAQKQLDEYKLLMEAQIRKIKSTIMPRDQIENMYNELVDKISKQIKDLERRQQVQRIAEEQERLRKLQEQMELERKRKEEEERRRKQEEEERMMRLEIEERRRKEAEAARIRDEEEKQIREKMEADRKIQEEKRKASEEEVARAAMQEQERRDRELALHLSQDPNAVVNETGEVVVSEPTGANTYPVPKRDEVTKKYDLTKWKYAELRDTINTSCDVELLMACKEEFHRRLKAYHHWKNKNKSSAPAKDGAPQRAPRAVIETAEQQHNPPRPDKPTHMTTAPSIPPRREQRYFRVPFQRPSEQYQPSPYKKQGWWYAHFDGQWIARQLEIHPGSPPLLLIAGRDDMNICELSLEETDLTRRYDCEITSSVFEDMWLHCGGTFDDFTVPDRHY